MIETYHDHAVIMYATLLVAASTGVNIYWGRGYAKQGSWGGGLTEIIIKLSPPKEYFKKPI